MRKLTSREILWANLFKMLLARGTQAPRKHFVAANLKKPFLFPTEELQEQ